MANTPIIPGVPTPISGDPKCALTLCGRIIAQVDCVIIIMQGTNGCIDIQFFGKDGKPLDLTRFSEIQIMLYNEFDCTVANEDKKISSIPCVPIILHTLEWL